MYEAESFVPTAKLTGKNSYSIVSNYLGTPMQTYDNKGNLVWGRELDIYGCVRKETKENSNFVPFRFQGRLEHTLKSMIDTILSPCFLLAINWRVKPCIDNISVEGGF